MDIQETVAGGVLAARLSGEMTIYCAAEFKDRSLGWLQRAGQVEVDLAGVSEFDTTGAQLLLVLKREAKRHERVVRYVNHSRAVREVVDLYDLAGAFGDPILIPSELKA